MCVRADLQRFFGLNIDRMGDEFSAFHAGACLSCLPYDSALVLAVSKDEEKRGKAGLDGIETEYLPLDQFIDWYENTTWKEVDECQVL